MSAVPMTIPANPDTIAAKSLDDDGWIPYPLGDDVLSGEPNTEGALLRPRARQPRHAGFSRAPRQRGHSGAPAIIGL
jgi:hypothetical protein